jgi:hypothetical protein
MGEIYDLFKKSRIDRSLWGERKHASTHKKGRESICTSFYVLQRNTLCDFKSHENNEKTSLKQINMSVICSLLNDMLP